MTNIKIIQLIIILFNVFFASCVKEYENKEIDIKYEFYDDVSPVKTIFKVQEDLHWSHWIISDTSEYYPDFNNYIEHVFHYVGNFTVKIEASALGTGDKYYGNLEVQTPPLANRFIIYGFYFTDEIQFNIDEDSLKIKFDYFDSYTFTPQSRLISKTAIESNDSVFFDKPIIYDITGFDKVEYNLTNRFDFWIKTQSETSTYFQTMFYLNEKYYQDRVYDSPNLIYLSNDLEAGSKSLILIVDWTNY